MTDTDVLQDDLRDLLRALGKYDSARAQSPHQVFRECIADVGRLRAALTEIAEKNREREFVGNDKSDGYGDEGWVTRDGQFARIARAALSSN
jgi:hypothetical protein